MHLVHPQLHVMSCIKLLCVCACVCLYMYTVCVYPGEKDHAGLWFHSNIYWFWQLHMVTAQLRRGWQVTMSMIEHGNDDGDLMVY